MISIIPGSFNLSFTIIELKLEAVSIELIGGIVSYYYSSYCLCGISESESFFFITFIYLHTHTHMLLLTWGNKRPVWGSRFSPSNMCLSSKNQTQAGAVERALTC